MIKEVKTSLLVLCGFSAFSLSDAMVKLLGSSYQGTEIVAVTSTCISCLCLVWYLVTRTGEGRPQRTSLKTHLVRSLLLVVSTCLNFSALPHIELSIFYTIMFTSPLFMTVIAWGYFKERLEVTSLLALILGFLGVFIGVGGDLSGGNNIYSILLLISAFLFAASTVLSRKIGVSENPLFFAWFPKLASATVLFPYCITFFQKAPSLFDLTLVALISVFDMFAYVALGIGFQRGVSSNLAPLQYVQLLWGIFWGWLIWTEIPSFQGMFGALLVVFSGYVVLSPPKSFVKKLSLTSG